MLLLDGRPRSNVLRKGLARLKALLTPLLDFEAVPKHVEKTLGVASDKATFEVRLCVSVVSVNTVEEIVDRTNDLVHAKSTRLRERYCLPVHHEGQIAVCYVTLPPIPRELGLLQDRIEQRLDSRANLRRHVVRKSAQRQIALAD